MKERSMVIRHTFSDKGPNPAVHNQEQTWTYTADEATLAKIVAEHYDFLSSGLMTKFEVTFTNTSINHN